MEALSATAQDDSSGANPSSVKSDDSSPQQGNGSSSPPPNCAICLGTCKNKSFTDSCLHQFCFSCLLTWSKVKAECPLCKQAFRSIIHNVRSNNQYEEYLVVQRQTEESSSQIDIDRVTTATHRFRYRTTLTLPRRETIAIQELLLHYPFMADMIPRTPPARRRRSPASFRRTVYRHNLWARPLPDFTGRYRDCSPEFYRYNNTQMHRLVPWINRELYYLLNENVGHISYVMSRILELLPQHHINSSEFREAMQRYFGERTEHFLHELYCFASTPYDMAGYDRNVQYTTDTRISTMINEVLSSSDTEASVDSDIVMVSSSAPADPPPGPSRLSAPAYPQSYISQPTTTTTSNVIPIETISHSDTDDDSSEVMVVGYIKPPQDRTPEIVDLLGSDSDVILQDTQPETTANSVKVTLKRHKSRECNSNSDSDSTFVPPAASKRRRRRRRTDSTTSDMSSTPEHARASWSDQDNDTSPPPPSSDSDDYNPSYVTREKKRWGTSYQYKSSQANHKETRNGQIPQTDKRSGRKSNSGKGVKSSNKNNSEKSSVPPERTLTPEGALPLAPERAVPPVPSEPIPSVLDQPGTSGTSSNHKRKSNKERNRRLGNRETRRLRSVVNVMYNSHRNNDESNSSAVYPSNVAATSRKSEEGTAPSSSGSRPERAEPASSTADTTDTTDDAASKRKLADSSSDSEDNLPLNLTLQKIIPSSIDMKCL